MDYRPLGSTGINVSEIGFGCGNVGGLMIRGEHGDQVTAVARAMELGINYFDTASSYGDGQSETNLGRVLKELSADVYVGTKFRVTTHEPGRIKGNVIASVEESLSRLQREQVDLIQMHNHVASTAEGGSVSPDETLGEVADALRVLRNQGKVRFWGMTAVGETTALHRVIDSGTLNIIQAVYNLVNPSAGAAVPPGFDMPDYGKQIERASANGMGVLVIRVLAAGALSGEAARHPVAVHDRRAHRFGPRLRPGPVPGRGLPVPAAGGVHGQPGVGVVAVRPDQPRGEQCAGGVFKPGALGAGR